VRGALSFMCEHVAAQAQETNNRQLLSALASAEAERRRLEGEARREAEVRAAAVSELRAEVARLDETDGAIRTTAAEEADKVRGLECRQPHSISTHRAGTHPSPSRLRQSGGGEVRLFLIDDTRDRARSSARGALGGAPAASEPVSEKPP